jgi:hypothetical protein
MADEVAPQVTVSDYGVTFHSFRTVIAQVPWENIGSVRKRHLGAALNFRGPQQVGWRTTKKLTFVIFDPRWRRRPVSLAIGRRMNAL